VCIGGNDLVLIDCYYNGNPVVEGDNFQDHVTEEDAGRRHDTGHIPDYYINLGDRNPNNPAIHIGHCG
jgi:hypothetical protein